jgi:hypothetical protein
VSRSERYIELFEGFKLGSLGVSRKPKVTSEPELPLVSKVTGFRDKKEFGLKHLSWFENFDAEITRLFKLSKKATESGDDFELAASLTFDPNQDGGAKPFVPVLHLLGSKNGRLFKGLHLLHNTLSYPLGSELGNDWLEKQKSAIQKGGLFAVEGFPLDWHIYRKD